MWTPWSKRSFLNLSNVRCVRSLRHIFIYSSKDSPLRFFLLFCDCFSWPLGRLLTVTVSLFFLCFCFLGNTERSSLQPGGAAPLYSQFQAIDFQHEAESSLAPAYLCASIWRNYITAVTEHSGLWLFTSTLNYTFISHDWKFQSIKAGLRNTWLHSGSVCS